MKNFLDMQYCSASAIVGINFFWFVYSVFPCSSLNVELGPDTSPGA